jgi:hypothetical protein
MWSGNRFTSSPVVRRGPRGPALVAAVLAGALVPVVAAAPATTSAAQRGLRRVTYRGYSLAVPRGWQVIDLARHPHACVRFDHHTVYLGAPPHNQSCPSSLVGTTDAMLVGPGPRHAAAFAIEDTVARTITVRAPRIRVLATFARWPTKIGRILAGAGLPRPVAWDPGTAWPDPGAAGTDPPGAAAGRRARRAGRRGQDPLPAVTGPPLPSQATSYRGLGFDTCAAPSTAAMRAWRRSSPYRAVGIYIGGADRACAQPNLTPAWLRQQAAAGWHFIPMYVGPQAAFGELGRSAASQGAAAASDAVNQAAQLGFAPPSPIYYDMEAYPRDERRRVLSFLSAWTASLHAYGYLSGVYSSSSSGIADLAHQYHRGRYAMPDVIFDAWWNGRASTSDPVYGAGEWLPHRRLHQYRGNVTQSYGGVTIEIDQDDLNVELPGPPGTPVPSQAVTQPDGDVSVFYRGAAGQLWYVREVPGRGWASPVDLAGQVASQPSAVTSPTGQVTVFYRGPGGLLWQVSSTSDGWSAPQADTQAGVLAGRPWAVSEPDGVIDVFWRGAGGSALWYAQGTPALGWSGPRELGAGLASAPAPVVRAPGTVQVFWKGPDSQLWQVSRGQNGQWGSAGRVGTGPLGGWPRAASLADGETGVFWRHDQRVLGAFLAPDGTWSGPVPLGGETALSPPVPVPAGGLAHVFFEGGDGGLWETVRSPSGQWPPPVRLLPGLRIPGLFAASAPGQAAVSLFWKGPGGQLWWASVSPAGEASAPRQIGAAGP